MRLGTPIDYLSSRGGRFPKDSLGGPGSSPALPSGARPRLSALLVIALGLATFFLPLINVDPPVLNTIRWSAFDIVQQMYQGNLHAPVCERCGEPAVRALVALPFLVTAIYLLMVVALFPLVSPYAMNTLAVISALGGIGSLYLRRNATARDFERTFYGHWSDVRHVHYGLLQLALLGIMGTLFLIAINGDTACRGGISSHDSRTPVARS
jgi:hypothetical protein